MVRCFYQFFFLLCYNTFRNILAKYEDAINEKIKFKNLDKDIIDDFFKWMVEEMKYSNYMVNRIMKRLKNLIKEAGLNKIAVSVNPEIILMDEPCSALDPIATARIEELIEELKKKYTIVIVTHSMQQAARVSDRTAYMHMGELVETGFTKNIFSNPQHQKTQDYITGRIG